MPAPHARLEKLYHEPSRLAIMSELCGVKKGLSFTELKTLCELTDGNLSRHLAALEQAQAVRIEKAFVDAKPKTTVFVTTDGRKSFLKYLQALEDVLQEAARRFKPEKKIAPAAIGLLKPKKT